MSPVAQTKDQARSTKDQDHDHLGLVREVDWVGVGDGYRTRDLLSHSQAFYH